MKKSFMKYAGLIVLSILIICTFSACEISDVLEIFATPQEESVRYYLNTEYLTVMKGDTSTLTVTSSSPTTAPSFSVVWLTDNPNIVVVDEGVIYGASKGTTNIRARLTVHADTPYTKELVCTVNVEETAISINSIELDAKNITLEEMASYKLNATLLPSNTTDRNIIWKSSDPAIATVAPDGTIVANVKGTTTISVISAESPWITTSCEVTVIASETNTAKSIKLNKQSEAIVVGDILTLTATVSPSSFTGTITWTSNNIDVASVSDTGKVKALSKGTAYITAAAGNASTVCKITVSEGGSSIIAAESVELDKTYVRVINGSTSIKLNAVIRPFNSTETGLWSSSNTSIATVSNTGLVTVKALGQKESASAVIKYEVNGTVYATCELIVVKPELVAVSVEIEQPITEMYVGTAAELTAKFLPETAADTWIWESSDPEVIKVTDIGMIYAMSKGTAAITVRSKEDGSVKAVCQILSVPKEVDVYFVTNTNKITSYSYFDVGIEFSNSSAIPADAIYTVTIDKPDTAELLFSRLQNAESTVTLTPLKTGTVTLSLEIQTDSTKHTYICHDLTLEIDLPTIEGIHVSSTEIVLNEGESTDIVAVPVPAAASDLSVSFSSADSNIVSTVFNKLVAKSAGETTVKVYITDYPEVYVTCHVTVLPLIPPETSVDSSGTEITDSDNP